MNLAAKETAGRVNDGDGRSGGDIQTFIVNLSLLSASFSFVISLSSSLRRHRQSLLSWLWYISRKVGYLLRQQRLNRSLRSEYERQHLGLLRRALSSCRKGTVRKVEIVSRLEMLAIYSFPCNTAEPRTTHHPLQTEERENREHTHNRERGERQAWASGWGAAASSNLTSWTSQYLLLFGSMEEQAFKTELAKYRVVRAHDYIRTQYKESAATARPTPLQPGGARTAASQHAPVNSDNTFWDLMAEIVGADMDASTRDSFFAALKQVCVNFRMFWVVFS